MGWQPFGVGVQGLPDVGRQDHMQRVIQALAPGGLNVAQAGQRGVVRLVALKAIGQVDLHGLDPKQFPDAPPERLKNLKPFSSVFTIAD